LITSSDSCRLFLWAAFCAGVFISSSGLSVYRLNRAAAAVEVFNGLSDDGLWGIISADSATPAPVVYLHRAYSQLQVRLLAELYVCGFACVHGLEVMTRMHGQKASKRCNWLQIL
jgi:hypothetical protein